MIRPCIMVPHYNHHRQFERALDRFRQTGLPMVLVDDGSHAHSYEALAELASSEDWITLVRHGRNRGKGAAILSGIDAAAEHGYTHAVQIDADGQHDFDDLPKMLSAARAQPEAIVSGEPVYGADIPEIRRYGRRFAHVWVDIETLSRRVRDAMCGYRVYPVEVVQGLALKYRMGPRMPFDTEVLVRADWEGVPLVYVPTPVCYPEDGLSHYRYFHDNVEVVWTHIKLLAGMLPRSPELIRRHFRKQERAA